MATMALEMRSLVLVLDGIDEAASRATQIANLVHKLVSMGFRVVCTSRPEGVTEADFVDRFVVFNLRKLNEDQQRQAIEQQLQEYEGGREFSMHLLACNQIRREQCALPPGSNLASNSALKHGHAGVVCGSRMSPALLPLAATLSTRR